MAKRGKWVLKEGVMSGTNDITESIKQHILRDGWSASRINTTGIWVEEKQCFISGGGRNGFSDIAACIMGIGVAIEVKKGKDEQRKKQIEFQAEWEAAGGLYIIAPTYREFIPVYEKLIKYLNEHFTPLPTGWQSRYL